MYFYTSLINLLHYFKIYCPINIKITCQDIFQVVLVVKNPGCQFRRHMRCRFNPWVRKISWRRARQPTPIFLPGECQGQRSLAGYSSWNLKRVRHDWSDLALMHATCQDEPWSSKTFYSQSGLGTSSIGKELVRDEESQNLKYSSEPLEKDLH